jgi:glycosyltransferase involved in cell wall biosynthesis
MRHRQQFAPAKRHCMVVHAYYPARETRVLREAAALVERGVEVDVLCLREGDEPSRLVHEGVKVIRLPVGRRPSRGFALQLLEYLAFFVLASAHLTVRHLRQRYDTVQVHNLPDFLVFAALVPKLMGTTVLLDLHDLMPEFFAAKTDAALHHPFVRLLALQEQLACRFADHVITVTDDWRDTLVERGVPREKVSVVMNVADGRVFHRGTPPAEGGVDQVGLNLIYHGTFTLRYGVDLILAAVDLLRDDLPGLRLTLQGSGEALPALLAQQEHLDLGEHVRISTDVVDTAALAAMIRAADVGIVPNRRNLFTDGILPTKLMEYVAMGTPVIAARTPAIERYFDDDMVQFFEPGNAEDLAKAIRMLAADPARRMALAESADAFNRKYDWETTAAAYAELITGASRRPGSGVRNAPMLSGETDAHPDRNAATERTP